MKRDIQKLVENKYDVLVLGAGIHGATIASVCAQSGLSTALIEKKDFGHATSANSLKIIHGGLRYLQHLNIKRMRDSIASRKLMMAQAPHCVRPLSCLIPNHGNGLHSNFLMRLALFANDLVGYDRNSGSCESHKLLKGEVISKSKLTDLFPDIVKPQTTGASIWHDVLAVNSERLTFSFVEEAEKQGATVANYLEAVKLLVSSKGNRSVRVRDSLTRDLLSIRADCIVNACGPWGEILSGVPSPSLPTSWAKAVNIVVKRELFPGYAVGLTGEPQFSDDDSVLKKKGRFFFFVPWRGYTMIGTTYKPYHYSPDTVQADTADVDEMISLVMDIYPEAKLTKSDVSFAHAGLVPMAKAMTGVESEVQLTKESMIIDHGLKKGDMAGIYTIKGVKYTTAPKVASDLTVKICSFLKRAKATARNKGLSLETTQTETGNSHVPTALSYLELRYGTSAARVLPYVEKSDRLLSESPLFREGEVDYMVEEEMVCTLSDIVFRRCGLATAEAPAITVLTEIAARMGNLLSWDVKQQDSEVQEVLAFFAAWK